MVFKLRGYSKILFFLTGLCGNFNGEISDDLRLLNSLETAGSETAFGNQFQTTTKKKWEFFCYLNEPVSYKAGHEVDPERISVYFHWIRICDPNFIVSFGTIFNELEVK